MPSGGTTSLLQEDEPGPPRASILKAVTISEEPDEIAPLRNVMDSTSPTLVGSRSPKLHRASMPGRKLSGRPPSDHSASAQSLTRQISGLKLDPSSGLAEGGSEDEGSLLSQVINWLHEEKAKRANRKKGPENAVEDVESTQTVEPKHDAHQRSGSQGSEGETALNKLERILAGFASTVSRDVRSYSRRGSIAPKRMKRNSIAASSDTEYQDGELMVPNVEAVLDNTKTMAFTGGGADEYPTDSTTKAKDKEHWVAFKREILRLTHTLRLKGWRNVPMENSGDIDVERLCGALTNAVYVVSPPRNLPDYPIFKGSSASSTSKKKPPPKLLLRIYGPQVEHLINRESELAILRRLARKRIGPRMLGTFTNGRFEEFFHARTLTAEDLRVPDTSKQIAKRMRELHDGIDLLEEERDGGPYVWAEWDKWALRSEQVVTWLDKKVQSAEKAAKSNRMWMSRGFVCGVQWPFFRKTVEKLRKHVDDFYGGESGVREKLVFAHNDTQYGNLMRLEPSGESSLLHPVNEHKQLVVIDFEYANANTPGYEFANHFNEWCYNYHHPTLSWACDTNAFPTLEEQYRFVKAYVMHRPQFNPAASSTPKLTPGSSTPRLEAMYSSISGFSSFMLDSRYPGGKAVNDYDAEEKEREEATEREIQRLIRDARMWRAANSAHWVAWGIVQAKVLDLDEATEADRSLKEDDIEKVASNGFTLIPQSDPLDPEVKGLQEDAKADRPERSLHEEAHRQGDAARAGQLDVEEEDDDEFDCLAYSQDRAFFFWGDCVQLGLVKEEELPEKLRAQIKYVKW